MREEGFEPSPPLEELCCVVKLCSFIKLVGAERFALSIPIGHLGLSQVRIHSDTRPHNHFTNFGYCLLASENKVVKSSGVRLIIERA